jgi:Zn-dependent protease
MTAQAQTTDTAAPARGVSPTAWLLLLAWIALGASLALSPAFTGPLTFAFVLVGWVLSVMAHEFAHALVAYLGGDHTVAAKGYLTLDPFHYMDAATSIVIPIVILAIGGIGFPGGAVYLRQDLMRGRLWRSAAVLAGPAGTLVVLLALSAGLALLQVVAPGAGALAAAVAFLAFLQATALILNLMPIPGLDGYGALRPFLPGALTKGFRRLEGLIFVGFVVLLLTSSEISNSLFGAAFDLSTALGVPRDGVAAGFDAFRFWR